jgi:hypothetical protein
MTTPRNFCRATEARVVGRARDARDCACHGLFCPSSFREGHPRRTRLRPWWRRLVREILAGESWRAYPIADTVSRSSTVPKIFVAGHGTEGRRLPENYVGANHLKDGRALSGYFAARTIRNWCRWMQARRTAVLAIDLPRHRRGQARPASADRRGGPRALAGQGRAGLPPRYRRRVACGDDADLRRLSARQGQRQCRRTAEAGMTGPLRGP